MQPIKGWLEPGQRAAVRTSFCPQDRVRYMATIPVYLDGNRDKSYLELVLKGEGIFPMITFYPHEVFSFIFLFLLLFFICL